MVSTQSTWGWSWWSFGVAVASSVCTISIFSVYTLVSEWVIKISNIVADMHRAADKHTAAGSIEAGYWVLRNSTMNLVRLMDTGNRLHEAVIELAHLALMLMIGVA